MIARRDVLIGAGCVAALGTAEYLRPRRILTLFDGKLETAVPRHVGVWVAEPGGDFVVPNRPGSLADRLYTSQITRNYRRDSFSAPVMLVIAYGGAQSDSLQLHRPESCYPAVGFSITQRRLITLPLGNGFGVPAVVMSAKNQDRIEDIVYWTRVGEYLPQTAGQQRKDRLATSFDGYIGDGMLVRASIVRQGATPDFAQIEAFLSQMVAGIAPRLRRGFVGTALANRLNS